MSTFHELHIVCVCVCVYVRSPAYVHVYVNALSKFLLLEIQIDRTLQDLDSVYLPAVCDEVGLWR